MHSHEQNTIRTQKRISPCQWPKSFGFTNNVHDELDYTIQFHR